MQGLTQPTYNKSKLKVARGLGLGAWAQDPERGPGAWGRCPRAPGVGPGPAGPKTLTLPAPPEWPAYRYFCL